MYIIAQKKLALLLCFPLLLAGCAPADSALGSVDIYLGNELYQRLPFDDAQVVTIDQGDGVVNEITLTGDAVYMSHSSCPNQDCVQQGAVSAETHGTRPMGGWIVCLPNRVSVEYVPGATP